MKKLLALILASLMLAAALAACASPLRTASVSANIRLTSSDAESTALWLTERLGDKLTDRVVLGTSADAFGVDLSALDDDGYIIRALGAETAIFARTTDGLDRAARRYAKGVEAGTPVSDVTYHEGARIKKLTLGGVDVSEFVISYADSANADILYAANELSRLIEIATGVKLTVAGSVAAEHVICFEDAPDEADLGDYGYEYEVGEGRLVIRSGISGAMNGVRRFLENELDWRGLSFGEAELTPAEALYVPAGTKRSERPAFDYMFMYYNAWGSYGNPVQPSNSYGKITCAMHGMQSNRFADVDFRFEQICYTDEYRYGEVHDNVVDLINARLANGAVVGVNFFDVDIAQGDNNNYCTCKNCRKVFSEEGSNVGAVLRFANRLSEEINEVDYEFGAPLYFKIFAYSGSNQPPKVTVPNEYIYVTFCTDMNCSNHFLDGSECTEEGTNWGKQNKMYSSWLEGWCKICKNVYVWDYALDTVLAQYTVTDTIYRDFKYLADLGVKGIFWQCQFHGLGIQRVEHQLLSELNWNMDMTEEEFESYLCDILRREYGDGWEHIRRYLDIWNAEQDTADCWNCWSWDYHMFCVDKRFDEYSVAAHFDECYDIFESAIAEANSRAQEIRLLQLSCHMIYEGCYCSYRLALEAEDEARQAQLCERYDTMVARLKECGFNIHCIYTVDGAHNDYEETLPDEFANYWAGSKDSKGHGEDPWYEAYFAEYGGMR